MISTSLDQLLAHVEPADEMGRHADVVQMLEDVLRNPVVEHALAVDHLVLLGIEGGGIILENWISVPGSGPS
jgi:hypothetical protein